MQIAATAPAAGSRGEHDRDATRGHASIAAQAVLLVLGFYIVSKPYYLLPSGLPQVADMSLVAGMTFALFLPRLRRGIEARKFVGSIVVFCLYAAIVSIGWTFVLMDPRVALYAAYYAFNLCLVVLCLRVGALHTEATLRVIAYAVALSAVIQAGSAALTFNAAHFRQIASFNNPNQLAYWSLLSLCIFWSIGSRIRIAWYIRAGALAALAYTVAISLSKAAMIATVLLILLHFLKKPKLILLVLVVAVVGYLALENSSIAERISSRLENIGGQADDSFYARGYLRILGYPEYAVIGAGEGAIYRFNDVIYSDQDYEIHSTFGTILFSYGAVGMAAFASAIFYLYRIAGWANLLYLAPPFLYGLTHQGLRFSFLWLLLAVIALLGRAGPRQSSPQKHGATLAPQGRRAP
ncbi:MAG TPA: hypothetical protein VGF43_10255 [Dongiaceae bacterium]